MKFLIDMPVSPELVKTLTKHGHAAVHARDAGLAEADDSEIVARARKEARVIVTADLDFVQLLAMSNEDGPGVILFRGGNYSESEMRELLERVLTSVDNQVLPKSICVVDKKRVRVTRLPLKGKSEI